MPPTIKDRATFHLFRLNNRVSVVRASATLPETFHANNLPPDLDPSIFLTYDAVLYDNDPIWDPDPSVPSTHVGYFAAALTAYSISPTLRPPGLDTWGDLLLIPTSLPLDDLPSLPHTSLNYAFKPSFINVRTRALAIPFQWTSMGNWGYMLEPDFHLDTQPTTCDDSSSPFYELFRYPLSLPSPFPIPASDPRRSLPSPTGFHTSMFSAI